MKITNTQKGPRGVNTVAGAVLVNPGETVEVEVYQREKEHIEASGWFDVKGSYKANPDGETAAPALANQDAIDKAVAEARADVETVLADKDKEIADLKAQLDAAKKSGTSSALKAEHHGGGKFNVTEGETVHLSGLSKADADAFNAMRPADQKAYVDAEKAKA